MQSHMLPKIRVDGTVKQVEWKIVKPNEDVIYVEIHKIKASKANWNLLSYNHVSFVFKKVSWKLRKKNSLFPNDLQF